MAAETMGTLSSMFLENLVVMLTSRGKTSEKAGIKRTSS
jgi:hypothetical protein